MTRPAERRRLSGVPTQTPESLWAVRHKARLNCGREGVQSLSALLQAVATCLYAIVGIIALVMALKSLRAREFLPFHEAAAAQSWSELGAGLQAVILSLLRLSGLGFLIVAVQLGVVAIAGNFHGGLVVTWALPILSLLFCAGLCAVNLRLHRRTGAQTPWRGSLYAAMAIAVGLIVSSLR